MINLYSGTPGSGKSLHTAQVIKNWSRFGYPILANFKVNLPENFKRANFNYLSNEQITADYLIKYSNAYFKDKKKKEGQILLIIDECQIIFNAREWQKEGRASWLSFFSQHRKYGYDIILVAQFDRMIDRQIRSLIEYNFVHRKVSNFGIQGKILSLFFGGNTFCAVKVWYPLNQKVSSEFFHARKSLYSIYDTFNDF